MNGTPRTKTFVPVGHQVARVGDTIELADRRRGIIRYIGETEFAEGDFVGLELLKGIGKHDGKVQG